MLTTDPRIQPALVKGHFETLVRRNERGEAISRFRSVVDENGDELGAVSDRYKLIQTADIVAAFDLEAERRGLDIEPRQAFYRNGKAKITLDLFNRRIRNDTDGGLTPMVLLENGLGGISRLVIGTGFNIGRCGNGLWFGDVVSADTKKHTTGLNLGNIVRNAVQKLEERIEKDYHVIVASRATRYNFQDDLTKKIGEETPKRLVPTFKGIIQTNRQQYGDTVWAMLQAITELSTHHMRERRDGSHVWSADEWTRKQVKRVVDNYALATR